MRDRYLIVRVLEAWIALCTTYLALNSFFSSSIYVFISKMVKWLFEEMGFILKANLDASTYMPIILTILIFIAIAYEFAIGQERNIINIYQINFMLFIPEALSFSKLNWFNLLDAGYILQPIRGYSQVFLTGVIIMTSYSILTFTAQYRSNMRQYITQGVSYEQLKEVIENQAILSFLLGTFSATVIIIVSTIIPLIKNRILKYSIKIPFAYLILGVAASTGVIFWAILILRNGVMKANE